MPICLRIYWNLSDRRRVLLRSLSAMINMMRHPHSEATVDVPVPETQESTSWTCPFTRTRSRTTTRISCPTQSLALRPVEKSELHERVTKEIEIRQETQSEIVTQIAKNAPAIMLAVNRLNGLLADLGLDVKSIDWNTQLGHADPDVIVIMQRQVAAVHLSRTENSGVASDSAHRQC